MIKLLKKYLVLVGLSIFSIVVGYGILTKWTFDNDYMIGRGWTYGPSNETHSLPTFSRP